MEKISGFPALLHENKIIDYKIFDKYKDSNNYNAYRSLAADRVVNDRDLIFQAFLFTGERVIDLTYFDMDNISIEQDFKFNEENSVIPLRLESDTLYIVVFNPFNINELSDKLKKKYEHELIKIFIAERKVIKTFNDKLSVFFENYPTGKPDNYKVKVKDGIENKENLSNVKVENVSTNNKENKNMEEQQDQDDLKQKTIQQLLKQVLTGAINSSADEIHFEPYKSSYRVRFKQNNELFEFSTLPKEISDDVAEKIKEMAGLLPQSKKTQFGNLTLKINSSKSVDFKVSICPLYQGEKIVFNVRHNDVERLSFEDLGLETQDIIKINQTLNNREGVFIFNGNKRSGRTCSMYTTLKSLNTKLLNIYTIESNIGFYIDEINQIKVNKDFSYIDALDVIAEQDADVIMVDVVEDVEMLKRLFKLARSGRMILFSTNFRNNKEVMQYLIQSGISLLDIYTTLKLIISQALLKELCNDCKEVDQSISPMILKDLEFSESEIEDFVDLWQAKKSNGCLECGFKKTVGLISIFDLFVISKEMKKLIFDGKLKTFVDMVDSMPDNVLYLKAKTKFKEGIIHFDDLKELS